MIKKIFLVTAVVALGLALFRGFSWMNYSMDSSEVIRKLSGMRLAVGLFRASKGVPPSDIEELIRNGNLEAVPELKLKTHRLSSKVRNTAGFMVRDTGGWAYINDPKNSGYGTVYIDCAHADEKGRYWSWF